MLWLNSFDVLTTKPCPMQHSMVDWCVDVIIKNYLKQKNWCLGSWRSNTYVCAANDAKRHWSLRRDERLQTVQYLHSNDFKAELNRSCAWGGEENDWLHSYDVVLSKIEHLYNYVLLLFASILVFDISCDLISGAWGFSSRKRSVSALLSPQFFPWPNYSFEWLSSLSVHELVGSFSSFWKYMTQFL